MSQPTAGDGTYWCCSGLLLTCVNGTGLHSPDPACCLHKPLDLLHTLSGWLGWPLQAGVLQCTTGQQERCHMLRTTRPSLQAQPRAQPATCPSVQSTCALLACCVQLPASIFCKGQLRHRIQTTALTASSMGKFFRNQGCCLICDRLMRSAGLATKMRASRSCAHRQTGLTTLHQQLHTSGAGAILASFSLPHGP
jgi:hypothetical protein